MITKIECIDQGHAQSVQQLATETYGLHSIVWGKAVLIEVDPSDNRVPAMQTQGVGYIDEPTAEDLEALGVN